jgi:phosphomannomutase
MNSLLIFDLDGTLAESKSDLDGEMATLPLQLPGVVDVAIISGGAQESHRQLVR